MSTNAPLLQMIGVAKRFPGVVALDGVPLRVIVNNADFGPVEW